MNNNKLGIEIFFEREGGKGKGWGVGGGQAVSPPPKKKIPPHKELLKETKIVRSTGPSFNSIFIQI